MQVASIVPLPYLELIKGKPYHMCLAHLARRNPEYAEFYRKERENGSFVLMDNGAAEKDGQPVRVLIDLIETVRPTEVVLPDCIYEKDTTLSMSHKALHKMKQEGVDCQFMAVPQGNTIREWVECMKEMIEWPIHSIGISKFMTYKLGPCVRTLLAAHVVGECNNRGKDINIHLLGCAYDPREIATVDYLVKGVRGTDSSIPYVYANQGVNMLEAVRDSIPRSQKEIDFYNNTTPPGLISANIQVWEALCNGSLS